MGRFTVTQFTSQIKRVLSLTVNSDLGEAVVSNGSSTRPRAQCCTRSLQDLPQTRILDFLNRQFHIPVIKRIQVRWTRVVPKVRFTNLLYRRVGEPPTLHPPTEFSCRRLRIGVRLPNVIQEGFEQAAACVVAAGKAVFQLVAKRHQFIDLGDNAPLFGERRKGNHELSNIR